MHIDLSTFLAVLGVIATVIFGVLSIDLFKRKRNPGRLTLVKQSTIGLFNNIAKNFDEISILYKSEPIKENVVYIKASILNDGDIDIDGKTVERTLNLHLKSNLKWIKAKVTKTSPELICNSEINGEKQNLQFNFGLIRKREFFQFEALIETDNPNIEAEEIFSRISISHRIADTQKVHITSLLSEEQVVRKKKKLRTFGLTMGVQFLGIMVILLIQLLYFKDLPIYYKNPNGEAFVARAKGSEIIQLRNISSKEKISITIKEFQAGENYNPYIPKQTTWERIKSSAFMIPLVLIMFLYLIVADYLELRKTYKYYNIFNVSEGKIIDS